jgi:hypothetical protein
LSIRGRNRLFPGSPCSRRFRVNGAVDLVDVRAIAGIGVLGIGEYFDRAFRRDKDRIADQSLYHGIAGIHIVPNGNEVARALIAALSVLAHSGDTRVKTLSAVVTRRRKTYTTVPAYGIGRGAVVAAHSINAVFLGSRIASVTALAAMGGIRSKRAASMFAPSETAAIGDTLALRASFSRLTDVEAASAVHAVFRGRNTAVVAALNVSAAAASLADSPQAQLVCVARQATLPAVRPVGLQRDAGVSALILVAAIGRARALVAYLVQIATFPARAAISRVNPRINALVVASLERFWTLGGASADGAKGRRLRTAHVAISAIERMPIGIDALAVAPLHPLRALGSAPAFDTEGSV